ncbi:MAG TPA: glycosyltransferase family 1 protein, partial [Bacteroidetes bacterium]|nr:glycosyltransferase family 1 protein [Bacteroidota bacterium]
DVKRLEAWHYRRYFPKFAKKAAKIIAVSEYTRQDIVQQYGVSPDKIDIVYNACGPHFQPISLAEQQATRDQFTNGKAYFHTVGAIQPRKNLVKLIAAFDQFKEQSSSDQKLLIVGRKAWNFEKVIHSYASSQHKDDIIFAGYVSDADLNRIYGASSGLCYVPYFEGFGIPILEAMACDTPIITSKVTSMPEVAGDAAILVDPHKIEEIAKAMLRLHTSPDLASELIDKGKLRRQQFSWDQSALQVWNTLTKR